MSGKGKARTGPAYGDVNGIYREFREQEQADTENWADLFVRRHPEASRDIASTVWDEESDVQSRSMWLMYPEITTEVQQAQARFRAANLRFAAEQGRRIREQHEVKQAQASAPNEAQAAGSQV